jgi:hypothetical protein
MTEDTCAKAHELWLDWISSPEEPLWPRGTREETIKKYRCERAQWKMSFIRAEIFKQLRNYEKATNIPDKYRWNELKTQITRQGQEMIRVSKEWGNWAKE